jgi:hypothetical protein
MQVTGIGYGRLAPGEIFPEFSEVFLSETLPFPGRTKTVSVLFLKPKIK